MVMILLLRRSVCALPVPLMQKYFHNIAGVDEYPAAFYIVASATIDNGDSSVGCLEVLLRLQVAYIK